jgi:hypothetical protein
MLLRIAYKTYIRLLVIALCATVRTCPCTAGSQSLSDSVVGGSASSFAYSPRGNDSVSSLSDSVVNDKSSVSDHVRRDNDSVGSLPDGLTAEPPTLGEDTAVMADTASTGDSIIVRRAKTKEK